MTLAHRHALSAAKHLMDAAELDVQEKDEACTMELRLALTDLETAVEVMKDDLLPES